MRGLAPVGGWRYPGRRALLRVLRVAAQAVSTQKDSRGPTPLPAEPRLRWGAGGGGAIGSSGRSSQRNLTKAAYAVLFKGMPGEALRVHAPGSPGATSTRTAAGASGQGWVPEAPGRMPERYANA